MMQTRESMYYVLFTEAGNRLLVCKVPLGDVIAIRVRTEAGGEVEVRNAGWTPEEAVASWRRLAESRLQAHEQIVAREKDVLANVKVVYTEEAK